MDTENGDTAAKIRSANDDAPVKTARTEKGRVQDIRTVGGGQGNDTFIGTETIHLHEELVQGLFPFIMSPTQSASALTAYGIDFIDEYDTGGILLGLGEKVAYAGCAYADKHFHEVGA